MTSDADSIINYGNIQIGNGLPETIVDQGIIAYSVFKNYGNIYIDGTVDQGLLIYNDNGHFTNYSSGLLSIDNCRDEGIRVGNNNVGIFDNNGGTVHLGQNAGAIKGTSAIFVYFQGTLYNQNGGTINIDYTDNDGIRCDSSGIIHNIGICLLYTSDAADE